MAHSVPRLGVAVLTNENQNRIELLVAAAVTPSTKNDTVAQQQQQRQQHRTLIL